MTDVNVSYPDLSGGEVSPKLRGRHDLSVFYKGMRRMENYVSQSTGPAYYRTGTVFSNATAGDNKGFLWPFVFSENVAFILEFTDLKLRFFTLNGIVESGGSPVEVSTPYVEADLFELKFAQQGADLYISHPNYAPRKLTYTSATSWTLAEHASIRETFGPSHAITNVTQASPGVLTYTGSDEFSNGDKVFIENVVGMTDLNNNEYLVANVNTGANTFELQELDSTNLDTTVFSAYTSGGTVYRIVENATPFRSSGKYPVAVGLYEQRLIYGGGDDAPNTKYYSESNDFDNFTTGTEADEGIEYTIASNKAQILWLLGTSEFLAVGCLGDVFQATGGADGVITPSSISIKPTNSFGVKSINPVGRGTRVYYVQNNALIVRSFEYDFSRDSYVPTDRTLIADHITESGVTQIAFQEGRPDVLWATRTDGKLIGLTVEDGEAITGWHRHVTDGEVVSVASLPRSNDYDQVWLCVKRTINGATKYYIEYLDDIQELADRESFVSTAGKAADDTKWANYVFEQQKKYNHLDSSLVYDGTAQVTGTLTPGATTGDSVTFTSSVSEFTSGMVGRQLWRKSVTGDETGRAEITAFVSGTQVTCKILEDFDSTTVIPAGEWYLTTDSISGLAHLEAKSVSILADGATHDNKTVSSGAITLDRQASYVRVGLGFTGYLETNDLEGGGANGPAQTKRKRLHKIGVRFLDSLYSKVGTDYYNLEYIDMRKSTMAMDRPPVPFTGDVVKHITNETGDPWEAGWRRDTRVIIVQDLPFPSQVQLIVPYFKTVDK